MNDKRTDNHYRATPDSGFIIDGYNTKNLNKASYLLTRGARYIKVEVDENGIGTIWLDNVNTRHAKEYWKDDMTVEFWTFDRQRKFLKEEMIKEN